MAETFDNYYDPKTSSTEGETPTFDEVINDAIETHLKELHTWLPAKVLRIASNSSVDIQIQLQRRYTDGKLITLPTIQNVQIASYRNDTYFFKLPVKVGDTGVALFCERSLDVWLVSGGLVDPEDNRTHSFADCIFIPGLYPISSPFPVPASSSPLTDVVIGNGLAELFIQKNGKFMLKNATAELFSLMNQFMTIAINMNTQLSIATTNTLMGPQQLINFAEFVEFMAQLEAVQTQFQTLMGS